MSGSNLGDEGLDTADSLRLGFAPDGNTAWSFENDPYPSASAAFAGSDWEDGTPETLETLLPPGGNDGTDDCQEATVEDGHAPHADLQGEVSLFTRMVGIIVTFLWPRIVSSFHHRDVQHNIHHGHWHALFMEQRAEIAFLKGSVSELRRRLLCLERRLHKLEFEQRHKL
jgi:hypothetical protein